MSPPVSTLPDLLVLHAALIEIAHKAGAIALRDFRPGFRTMAEVMSKDGGSPVTSADHAVDAYLETALPVVAPLAYHSEEQPDSWRGDTAHTAFVVDPIDGTRNFIEGGDAWCIVIGVLAKGHPMAGVVHMPARRETFSAFRGGGAFHNGIRLAAAPAAATPLRATGPRPVIEWLGLRLDQPLVQTAPVPALAHRMLKPLTGYADLALANAGGHDWDIVASAAILSEAGAALITVEGTPPVYRLDGGGHPRLIAGSQVLCKKIGASLLTDTV